MKSFEIEQLVLPLQNIGNGTHKLQIILLRQKDNMTCVMLPQETPNIEWVKAPQK